LKDLSLTIVIPHSVVTCFSDFDFH
jgi:hypothetical protein